MFEDFENVNAKDQAIIEADLLEEFYREMQEDLEDNRVQEALDITPERETYWQEQQDLEFA